MKNSVKPDSEEPNKTNESQALKIDNKDKEILRLLNENARMTSKAIGAATNISREVADYRIKRLMKNRLISGYITIVNDRKLGFESYLLLIKLQNYTLDDEKRIINFLKEHQYIKWVLKSSGNWDIQTTIVVNGVTHLASVLDEINSFCGKNMRRYSLAIVVDLLVPENLSFLTQSNEKRSSLKDLPPPKKEEDSEPVKIDDKDRKLLRALSTDARASVVNISESVGLSADATNLRMKRLKKIGIIKKYQTVVDLSTLNYLLYSVFLKINNYNSKRESQIRTFLFSVPSITFAERIIGEWDIRLQISCSTPHEFEKILQSVREFLADDLAYYDFCLMMKEFKRVSYPKGIN